MKINNEEVYIDGIDKTILHCLMKDARQPVNQIAHQIGISGTAVHQRLKKLEQSGVVSGSQVLINPKKLGYKTIAFIGIYLDKAMRNLEAVRQLKNIPEVIECHYTTGNWSLFVKIMCRDNDHLMDVLNKKVQSIEGVSRTETFISLQQQLVRQVAL